ncbi:MAG: penicillin-binding protein 2 [Candidatus Paceibacteria bacterium]
MPKYFVKYKKTSIEPEEIFLDSAAKSSKEPLERLEVSVPALYIRIALFFAIGALLLIGLLTFNHQIVKGKTWQKLAEDNRLRLLFSEAPRGLIFDRYGKLLAENKMIFDVSIVSLDLPKEDELLKKEAKILAESLNLKDQPIYLKLKALSENPIAEAKILFPAISRDLALLLKAKENELPGIIVSGRFQRKYSGGPALSHVIGYTGRVSSQELKTNPALKPDDKIGRTGIEAFYDDVLRGKRGEVRYEIDSRLEVVQKYEESGYQPGKNIKLTIDSEFQKYLYQIMSIFVGARYGGGAAVAMDPQTGEILALVSVPSYDNNLFSEGISKQDFERLINSPQKPLFNRAISGEYSSGSTIKPFIAAAALGEKIIDPKKEIPDVEGRLIVPNPYDPSRPSIYRDWTVHGMVDMRRAIAESCNVYFYILGGGFRGNIGDIFVDQAGLGIERIKKYLLDFGWGKALGIDLPGEKSGLIPDPAWKKESRKSDPTWRIGDTYITSIGQGDILVTPLQLTVSTAIFANGGKLLKPYLLEQIAEPDGHNIVYNGATTILRSFEFLQEELRVIKEGMRLSVAAGSSRRLADLPFEVAGKTGSVQVSSNLEKTNAIFVSFMPYKDPKLVLTILVEGGGEGGATAVPLAREALTWYWQNRILNQPGNL